MSEFSVEKPKAIDAHERQPIVNTERTALLESIIIASKQRPTKKVSPSKTGRAFLHLSELS
ncbi:MAG: hypothetical protein ACUVUE_05180 [Candidatus Bathycorpusculaceae bacterium]